MLLFSQRSRLRLTEALRRAWRWEVALAAIAATVPTAIYFTFLVRQTENVPLGDDFVALLPFLSSWHDMASFGDRLALLWEQYSSHRIISSRLTAVLVYVVHGDLQFGWMKIIGACGWFALLASLVFARATRRKPLVALAAALLLMQPQGSSNLLIAMQAIQNVGVLLFGYWALRLSRTAAPAAFASAILLAIAAVFTSANGLLVFPVAAFLLWIGRQRGRALVFGVAGIVTWTAFFIGYQFERHSFSPIEFVGNAVIMLGGAATLGRFGVAVAFVAGAAIGIAAVWTAARPCHWAVHPVETAFLLYLLLSVAMAAQGRIGWSASYMLQDRYRIYGILCVVVMGILLVADADGLRRRLRQVAFLAIATGWCAGSYAVTYPSVLLVGQWSRAMAMNRQFGRFYLLPGSEEAWDTGAKNLVRAEQTGIYRPPELFSPADVRLILNLQDRSACDGVKLKTVRSEGDQGYVLLPDSDHAAMPLPDLVVALFSERPLVLAVGRIRLPLGQMFVRRRFLSDRFACIVPFAVYRRGTVPVHGLNRDVEGRLHVLWSATAECL